MSEPKIQAYRGTRDYDRLSNWLLRHQYDRDPVLVSLVLEWSSHWTDSYSSEWSEQQSQRVDVIGDWIEEHGGDREWATALMPAKE